MSKTAIRIPLFIMPAIAICALPAMAEESVSFTFAPPPITSPGAQISKLSFNFTSLEYELSDGSGGTTTTEYTLAGMNLLTKNQGGFLSFGLVAGSDDTDVTTLAGMNLQGGFEGASDSGFAVSGGLGFNLFAISADTSVYTSNTSVVTMQANLALQQRIALGDAAGITPYVSFAYTLGGSGTTEVTTAFGTTQVDTEVDPYLSTQIGLDIDVGGFSIAALVQESDNSSITSLNVGFEF